MNRLSELLQSVFYPKITNDMKNKEEYKDYTKVDKNLLNEVDYLLKYNNNYQKKNNYSTLTIIKKDNYI
jgi:hypothetical protein